MNRQIKHYYKINIHTERGKALSEFMQQCHEADMQADKWAAEHHAAEYVEPVICFAGGVSAVSFADNYTPDSEEWREIAGAPGLYEPNIPDDFDVADAHKRMSAGEHLSKGESLEISRLSLPTMQLGHLFRVLPYDSNESHLRVSVSPMIFQRMNSWYVATPVSLAHNDDVNVISEKTFYRNRLSFLNTH